MSAQHESRNDALVRFMLLPTIFLAVALLGGLRVGEPDHSFLFVAPPLITLILAVMLMMLFVRGHLIQMDQWLRADQMPLTNLSHALTLLTLFFAAAQAFNSVMPEHGLLLWLFAFFFLWTLWNNLFSPFDPRQLLRSLAAMFGLAFVLKHILVAALAAPEGSWLQKLTGVLLEGVSLGTVNLQAYAPATGYISFFTLALFVLGLCLLPRPRGLAVRTFDRSVSTPALRLSEPAEVNVIDAHPMLDLDEGEDDEPTMVGTRSPGAGSVPIERK